MKQLNLKKLVVKSVLLSMAISAVGLQVGRRDSENRASQAIPEIRFGLPLALAAPSTVCSVIVQNTINNIPGPNAYLAPVLEHIHLELYRFNRIETADIEMIFCQMVHGMGMNPDISNLSSSPQVITKTTPDGLHTVSLSVTAPTESFALANGYAAKAVVTFDGTQFLSLWWAGRGSSSKGYLIQGANPLEGDGMTRLKYALWDLSGGTQEIKILATQFATSYLTNGLAISTSKTGGDRAIYARASYNTVTKAVVAQSVGIRQDLLNTSSSSFKCIKTQVSGAIGGVIAGYRPAFGSPESVASTTKDGTNIDGVTGLVDSPLTAPGSGTPQTSPVSLPEPFDWSCSDLNNAATASTGGLAGAFLSNAIDFSKTPSAIFPN